MSRRTLITGASGFVGRHLVAACTQAGEVVRTASREDGVDLGDAHDTRRVVAESSPDVVHHLAAQAHVGRSWEAPGATLRDNVALTLNLLEAVRSEAPGASVVVVSSGEVYGPPARLPVDEAAPMRPQNPYAVSKAATDLLAGFYADAHGLRILRARAFNHAGPGQDPSYALASFARQTALGIAAGDDPVVITTGNPDTRRDFTDVRDVVRAYRLLAEHGKSGGTYNVCSGTSRSARELVALLGEAIAPRGLEHRVDESLIRAHEVMEIRGSHDALTGATGWRPEIPLEQTLADTVAWWRESFRGKPLT